MLRVFFFQAEDGIRDFHVTGVQTCALPIYYRKDGSPFWNDLYISPVLDEHGEVTHFVGVQNDISEEIRYQNELSFNASHDVLTRSEERRVGKERSTRQRRVE